MNRLRLTLALPLAGVLLGSSLLAACGGGDDDDGGDALAPDKWVQEVCDVALADKDKLDGLEARLTAIDFENDDPEDIHDEVLDIFKESDDLRASVREEYGKVPDPDIENGGVVYDTLLDRLELNEKQSKDAIDDLEALDPKDDDYLDQLLEVFNNLPDDPSLRIQLEDLAEDNDEVNDILDAFDEDPDCAAMIFDEEDGQAADPDEDKPTPQAASGDLEEWVAGFCTAFSSYAADLETLGKDIDQARVETPADGKRMLVRLFQSARNRSAQLQKDVEDLGVPDIDDGEEVQDLFEQGTSDLVSIFDDAVADARDVRAGNPQAYLDDLEALGAKFDAAFTELGETFDRTSDFDTGEIDDIAADLPECADLG